MRNDTVTLELQGEVSLQDLARGIEYFNALLAGLAAEVAADARVEWLVDELQAGSATATVLGQSEHPQAVARIVAAYGQVGQAMQRHERIPFSERVSKPGTQLVRMLDRRIRAVRLQTPEAEYVVSAGTTLDERWAGLRYSFGAVTGTIETLSSHGRLRFVLYDVHFDRAVTCYLTPGQEEMMRNLWGKKATVSGEIGREPVRGRAVQVRKITSVVDASRVPAGSYQTAAGVLKGMFDPKPEDVIRRIRDAE